MSTWFFRISFIFISCVFAAPGFASSDYPQVAISDYLQGCTKANGDTESTLKSCSCSIEVIASIIPYSRYEAAATFVSLGLQTGERGVMFRQGAMAKAAITELRRAQAEADIRCF